MTESSNPDATRDRSSRIDAVASYVRISLLGGILLTLVAVQPVLAQSSGLAFCGTDIAQTIKNIFTLIQFGGPLIGGVIALGTTVALPTVRRADLKKEFKEARNQAIVWGVIVAPLGTAIVGFLLNNVVAGGASCAF